MISNTDQEELNNPIKNWHYFGIFLFILIILAINWVLAYCIGEGWQDKGSFGSMFGLAGSFFSGLAFAGLIIALILQRHEIKIQHVELRNQRTELSLTREVFEQQKFDNTFFKLIEMYWKYYNELAFTAEYNLFRGVSAVNAFINYISKELPANIIGPSSKTEEDINKIFENNFDFTIRYVLAVKALVTWIDESKLEDLTYYRNFVVDLFSENEKIMILIFLYNQDKKDLMHLLYRYDIFGDISETEPEQKSSVYRLYKIYKTKLSL